MKLQMFDDCTAKVQAPAAATETLKDRPFQVTQGSYTTRNGCVLNPIGGGWYWLSSFGSPLAVERDLVALERAEFNSKPKGA